MEFGCMLQDLIKFIVNVVVSVIPVKDFYFARRAF
ncbi:hypothetical protein EMUR_03905 [Ehrlichia muris AS145]|uniref:Uncharacterized protein n=1 Tax=Ehrlichia muris AS145 TaxID=1423892 RepID=V9R8Z2_9RICK|nr:hypothetical protein EMUR_03905 [Ehrlichia muris AS145]